MYLSFGLDDSKSNKIDFLMQIFDGKQIPQRMVDGWNAFFFDKTEELGIFVIVLMLWNAH